MAVAHKTFLFGLDRAGKTTILKCIKGELDPRTKPTLAFNIDKLILDDIQYNIFDAPGQTKFRQMWSTGYNQAKILMYVLDISTPERFEEAHDEFETVIRKQETERVPLIFLFHKMDAEGARENQLEARKIFKLPLISKETERPLYQFQTSMKNMDSIQEVKDSLVDIVQKARWG
jgi:small GTP-binding protein